jgi:hypothetical protein
MLVVVAYFVDFILAGTCHASYFAITYVGIYSSNYATR